MAIWYEVENTPDGIKNFLDCNWSFHDFRIEKILYITKNDMMELFLKYDTAKEGVLLRFFGMLGFHVGYMDYEVDYLSGSTIVQQDDGSLVWINTDDWGDKTKEKLEELKPHCTWIASERIMWAVTDSEGIPVELPVDRVNQTWHVWGKLEKKHFCLKEFTENWNALVRRK